ncbi:MAG: DUF4129 domain-containing protein [Aquificales bacterium]|nr:DUF4129 domain-containing protein [Aquificales bacterium]
MSQAEASILLQPSDNHQRLHILWGYLQHEILYLAWILMEVALLTPFLASVLPATRAWPSGLLLIWLLLFMYLPFNLVRLMSTLDWPRSRQQLILAGSIFLIYSLTLRTLFYQPTSLFDLDWIGQFFSSIAESDNGEWRQNLGWFALIMFLWWRGLKLIGKEFSIHSAGRRLRVGGLILAPIIIGWSIDRLPWSAVPFILLFFLASLTAVALARVEEIEKQRSGRSVSLNPKWLISVGLAALLLILTTALITFIISGETMLTIAGLFDPLWRALYAGGIIVFNTIFNLLEPLLKLLSLLIDFLVGLFTPMMAQLAEATPAPIETSLFTTPQATEIIEVDDGTNSGFKAINILLMIAIVLAVTLALGRVYRKAEFAARENESATKDTSKIAKPKTGFGHRLLNRLGLLRGWRTAASIRRIYQNMCRAAAINGYSRADADTPFEYLATLAKAWPENQDDSRLITEAYVKVRYGELPESAAELDVIRQAWKRLEATPPIDEKKAQKRSVEIDPLN